MEQLDLVVYGVFIVSMVIGFTTILGQWLCSSKKLPDDLKILLIRFFFCHEAIHFARRTQNPYRYQMYVEYGLTNEQISRIVSISYMSIAIWNLFMPILLRKLGNANLITLVCVTLAVSSIFFSFGKYESFVIGQSLFSMAMPTCMMGMQDWWLNSELTLPDEYNSHFVFDEIRTLLQLIASLVISPMSSWVVENFGISSVFSLSPAFFFAAIILIQYLLTRPKSDNEKDKDIKEEDITDGIVENDHSVLQDFRELSDFFFKSNNIIFLPLMIDIAYAVSFYLYMQRMNAFLFTPNHKPKMGFVSGALDVVLLIGAQFISIVTRFVNSRFTPEQNKCSVFNVFIVALTLSSALFMISIYYMYDNKIIVFALICLNSFLESGSNTYLVLMRKKYYPPRIRNYLMTIVKLPTSLLSFVIVWFWKTEHIQEYALIAGISMVFCSLLALSLIMLERRRPPQINHKTDHNTELINIEVSSDIDNEMENLDGELRDKGDQEEIDSNNGNIYVNKVDNEEKHDV